MADCNKSNTDVLPAARGLLFLRLSLSREIVPLPSDSPSDFSFIVYFVLLFDLADELTKVHLSPPVLNMIYAEGKEQVKG